MDGNAEPGLFVVTKTIVRDSNMCTFPRLTMVVRVSDIHISADLSLILHSIYRSPLPVSELYPTHPRIVIDMVPQPCHSYCCSAFASFEDYAKVSAGDGLETEIHAIFAQENWIGEVNYEVLKPSLRLISEILQSDPIALFFANLIDSKVVDEDGDEHDVAEASQQLNYGSDPAEEGACLEEDSAGKSSTAAESSDTFFVVDGQPYYDRDTFLTVIPKHQAINDTIRARAQQILTGLADMVKFQVSVPELEGCSAVTDAREGPLSQGVAKEFRYGHLTHVTLSADDPSYTFLLDPTMEEDSDLEDDEAVEEKNNDLEDDGALAKGDSNLEDDGTDQNAALLVSRFMIARILLHELGHVADRARFGDLIDIEIFYDGSQMSEMGFELEAQAFGGIVEDINSCQSWWLPWEREDSCDESKARKWCDFMCLRPWPSACLLRDYRQSDSPHGWKGLYEPTREIMRRFGLSSIDAYFSPEWWKHFRKVGTALLPSQIIGQWMFRFKDGTSVNMQDSTSMHMQPMSYAEAVEELGPRRAHKVCQCSCPGPCEQALWDAPEEILAKTAPTLLNSRTRKRTTGQAKGRCAYITRCGRKQLR